VSSVKKDTVRGQRQLPQCVAVGTKYRLANMGEKVEGLSDLRRPSGRIYSLARFSFMIFLLFFGHGSERLKLHLLRGYWVLSFDCVTL
jgi:hypothetical protein